MHRTASRSKVTNRLIWDYIGGGSMTTIAGALWRWREPQQLQAEAPAAKVALPEAVDRTMREAVERLWAAPQEETRKEIERLTEAMNARVAEAVAERDGALAELKDARQNAEQVRAGLASTTERAGQAEARAAEIERRADGLQAELSRVHDNASAERERQTAAIATGQAALDAVREELASLKATAQAEQLADTLARAGIERDEARRDTAEARGKRCAAAGPSRGDEGVQQDDLMKAIAAKAERPASGWTPK
jgi:chromosome segregation ATPase